MLRDLKLSQASGPLPGPLTTDVLGHGHQVVVGSSPQVLRGLGQRQGVGRDGGGVGTQEPRGCFRPQEGVCS